MLQWKEKSDLTALKTIGAYINKRLEFKDKLITFA